MSGCSIRAASQAGAYLLRLEGDVRLTMCTALDEYFQRIFKDPEFASVSVDVTRAQGLDSTTLGMLAKLAIETHQRFHFKPAIYSCDAGIERLLHSMGFRQLFDLRQGDCDALTAEEEIPQVAASEDAVKARVLEAHRTLMALSEDNNQAFKDLVRTLEAS